MKLETVPGLAGLSDPLKIQLTISPETLDILIALRDQHGVAISDLLSKALALLVTASDANAEGKQIGIVSGGGTLETLIDVF